MKNQLLSFSVEKEDRTYSSRGEKKKKPTRDSQPKIQLQFFMPPPRHLLLSRLNHH